jgi:hypothetical protein
VLSQTSAEPATPAPWEQVVSMTLQNRGVAKVEKLGARWMLTIACDGVHSTYIDDTKLDLDRFSKGYVTARYHYVTRTVKVQCVKAPCPPTPERRVSLERLEKAVASAADEQASSRQCR